MVASSSLLKKGTGSELMAGHAVEKPPLRGACPLFQPRLALALAVVSSFSVAVARPPSQENRTVDNVLEAFDNLAHHGEWLGFANGAGAPLREDPIDDHIQGIARSPWPGTSSRPARFRTSGTSTDGAVDREDVDVIARAAVSLERSTLQ